MGRLKMKSKKYLVILLIMIITGLLKAQPSILLTNLPGDLSSQFESAFNKADHNNGFWIGYSIQKINDRNVMIGSFYFNDEFDDLSLRDLIYNTQKYQNFKSSYNEVKTKKKSGNYLVINHGSRNSDRVLDKETAILFYYDENPKNINDFTEISVCNLSYFYFLGGCSIYWLGEKESKSSVDFLFSLENNTREDKLRKRIISGISIHTDQPKVTSFLIDLINDKDEKTDLRKDATYWLGYQDNTSAFEELKRIIKNEPLIEIKKSAVFSIGSMDLPGSTDELIFIVKNNKNMEVRKNAVYALGNKAVKKAEEALKNIVDDDPDIEVKKAAVYALGNNLPKNIQYLIDIANNNSSLAVRKSAIYSLSNSNDERAFDALIEIAKK